MRLEREKETAVITLLFYTLMGTSRSNDPIPHDVQNRRALAEILSREKAESRTTEPRPRVMTRLRNAIIRA
jgi:hypothetical protein